MLLPDIFIQNRRYDKNFIMTLFLFIVNGFQAQYNMHIETKRQRKLDMRIKQRRTGGKYVLFKR